MSPGIVRPGNCNLSLLINRVVVLVLLITGCRSNLQPSDPSEELQKEGFIRYCLERAVQSMLSDDLTSLQQARYLLELAREVAPHDERVMDGLGSVWFREGDLNKAEMFFKRAIDINAEYDRPYAHLAIVAELRGHKEVAFELYSTALQVNPLNGEARFNRSELLKQLSRNTKEMAVANSEAGKAEEVLLKRHLFIHRTEILGRDYESNEQR